MHVGKMAETLKINSAQSIDGTIVLSIQPNETIVSLGRQHNLVAKLVK